MLRRYLIVNGITTALLYGAYLAFVPATPHVLKSVWATIDAFAMESSLLGPLVHRIVMVSSNL